MHQVKIEGLIPSLNNGLFGQRSYTLIVNDEG